RKIVDEFIQNINWYRFQRIFSEIFESSEQREKQTQQFHHLKSVLGEGNVSTKVANFIAECL
ncbi:MAG TPA: hypothetical protein PK354_09680, partial [bacterium]|nr:hypothetical protein [bacterium]